ncbi:hypothetical protein C8F01DRAFT_478554 [Mycena amicta]|nr:hypothetical protein C8F01DRAFT_478554 [Mycena amicta]
MATIRFLDTNSIPTFPMEGSRPTSRPALLLAPATDAVMDDLPVYTRREPTEHVYTLHKPDKDTDVPWAKLMLQSTARSTKSLPSFLSGDNIVGSFQLTSAKGDSIKSIVLKITGQLVTGASREDAFTFLKQEQLLWEKATSASPLAHGKTLFTFSVSLPQSVRLKDGKTSMQSYQLPETFLERHTRASISYEISLRITRGWLRPDSELKTRFAYIPVKYAPPPSGLRMQAYRERSRLLGPDIDPGGWAMMSPTVAICGILFKTRPVVVRCKIHLASPPSYARGTPIPLLLTLSSTDAQALALMSSPSAPLVTLRRTIRSQKASTSVTRALDWETAEDDLVRAALWPTGPASTGGACTLEGEIALPRALTTTSSIGRFSYSVVLSAIDATGFVPDVSTPAPILSLPVEIVTRPPIDCPKAIEYTPTSHVSLALPARLRGVGDEGDYYTDSPGLAARS